MGGELLQRDVAAVLLGGGTAAAAEDEEAWLLWLLLLLVYSDDLYLLSVGSLQTVIQTGIPLRVAPGTPRTAAFAAAAAPVARVSVCVFVCVRYPLKAWRHFLFHFLKTT